MQQVELIVRNDVRATIGNDKQLGRCFSTCRQPCIASKQRDGVAEVGVFYIANELDYGWLGSSRRRSLSGNELGARWRSTPATPTQDVFRSCHVRLDDRRFTVAN